MFVGFFTALGCGPVKAAPSAFVSDKDSVERDYCWPVVDTSTEATEVLQPFVITE